QRRQKSNPTLHGLSSFRVARCDRTARSPRAGLRRRLLHPSPDFLGQLRSPLTTPRTKPPSMRNAGWVDGAPPQKQLVHLRDGDVIGLLPDTLEPIQDRGKAAQLEATLAGDVRICVEGDVGDRVAVADEELPAPEVALHDAERRVAERPLVVQLSAALVIQ